MDEYQAPTGIHLRAVYSFAETLEKLASADIIERTGADLVPNFLSGYMSLCQKQETISSGVDLENNNSDISMRLKLLFDSVLNAMAYSQWIKEWSPKTEVESGVCEAVSNASTTINMAAFELCRAVARILSAQRATRQN